MRRILNVSFITVLLLFFCAGISSAGEGITQISEKKLFKISYVCHHEEMKIKEFHSGDLIVRTMDDKPVTDARITVDFEMPKHGGHRSMRRPVVSKHIADGAYKISLISFQMPGKWKMTVHVASDNKNDTAVFDLMVGEGNSGDHAMHMN